MKNIFSSIAVSHRKKKVVRRILSQPQSNEGVTNIHSVDPNNVGDYFSGPHSYFKELEGTELHVFGFKNQNKRIRENFIQKMVQNSIIVGGGGLLNRGGFRRQMKLIEDLTSKNKKVVLWGVGHNEKDPSRFGKVDRYNIDVDKMGLAGTRDFSMPGDYVPCVSCLHSIFNKDYEEKQKIGVVLHHETAAKPEIVEKFSNLPITSNSSDFKSLIEFIGSCQYIITDSYHGMYWSMLLEKKVAVIPNSSKFFDFKYKPVFTSFDNCLDELSKTNHYSGILEESRSLNYQFAEKVFDYLDL